MLEHYRMLEHTPLSSSTCVKDFGICQKVDDEGNLNELSSFPYSCIAYMLLLSVLHITVVGFFRKTIRKI